MWFRLFNCHQHSTFMLKNTFRFYNSFFYNRKVEVADLTNLLNLKPTFTVLLGPPSSGKTALVRNVIEQGNKTLFHALQLDLRGTSCSSPDVYMKLFTIHHCLLFVTLKFLLNST